jgi:hypothetical protein
MRYLVEMKPRVGGWWIVGRYKSLTWAAKSLARWREGWVNEARICDLKSNPGYPTR